MIVDIQQVAPGRSVLIMSVFGREKTEKTVLLNSHTDVVPVNQV
jgi:acetylornithine deacetylase/succinyl-diaminopimelate desuccinylase-like protein